MQVRYRSTTPVTACQGSKAGADQNASVLLRLTAACGRPPGNALAISCATMVLASRSRVSEMLLSCRGFAHVNLHQAKHNLLFHACAQMAMCEQPVASPCRSLTTVEGGYCIKKLKC